MKKAIPYEIVATILALFGLLFLAGACLPLLDHEKARLATGHTKMPLTYFLVSLPGPLLMLAASWHFNRRGIQLRKNEQSLPPQNI